MADVQGLISNWSFVPSDGSLSLRVQRFFRTRFRRRPVPEHRILKPATQRRAWIAYFVFAPDGRLTPSHRFTLERLRAIDAGLLVVCACRKAEDVPADILTIADAVCWKALSGYDFSAYSLALRMLSTTSEGATVLVMNDSIVGPFVDLTPFIANSPWDLTGMTASSLVENHLQSYAFVVRELTASRMEHLGAVFPETYAYDESFDVIVCQETYFARAAMAHMSVGAYWFAPNEVPDPTLNLPLPLLDAGFPFMKKSLFGKHSKFQSGAHADLHARLQGYGHPAELFS